MHKVGVCVGAWVRVCVCVCVRVRVCYVLYESCTDIAERNSNMNNC